MGLYTRRNMLAVNWMLEQGTSDADVDTVLAHHENSFGMGDVDYTPEDMLEVCKVSIENKKKDGKLYWEK